MDKQVSEAGINRYVSLAQALIRAPRGTTLITGPSNKVFTQEEANVLTKDGFIAFCNSLRERMTYKEAYEATEVVHQRVHIKHERKYQDFEYFRCNANRSKKKAPTS